MFSYSKFIMKERGGGGGGGYLPKYIPLLDKFISTIKLKSSNLLKRILKYNKNTLNRPLQLSKEEVSL